MIKSQHIDGFGRKKDRKGVALIQRLQGSSARKDKAEAKRQRRAAKRRHENVELDPNASIRLPDPCS